MGPISERNGQVQESMAKIIAEWNYSIFINT